jgi:hypothetical protein
MLRDNSLIHEADVSPAELYSVMLIDEMSMTFLKF